MKYFKYEFTEEGIFLVEHLLLKPTVKDYKLMGGIGCMSIEGSFRIMYDLEEKKSQQQIRLNIRKPLWILVKVVKQMF
ncbi:hypothetical protein EJ377_17270 [Chryseobacterium arthrosphaerae]|uniref:Uncharacterized protein n=1 Tax=Chryseobacterium arthrosphaerae TaxID=651561 RepID=A0A3S0QFF8_9FLAO|nr:hypothetical protein EJ377_17270 [Chryseobacterium arthrosphaerae]